MPAETRHYVPKLIALKHIVLRPDAYGVALPALPDRPYFATIEKTRPIDLTLAAQFAGMSVDEFVALNPAHNRPVITASRNNRIKLPADRVDDFQAAMDRHTRSNKPLASWQPYTLKPGESVDDVARRGNVATGELLRANGLAPGARILAGTQLLAPQPGVKDEMQVESFAGARVYQQVTVPPVYHVVRKRDSLAAIASSYGTSVTQLRAWNGGVKAPKPGSSLLVRAGTTQTVLTTADGNRQVVARAAAARPPASRAAPALVQSDSPRAKPTTARGGAKSPPPKAVKAASRGKRAPASAKGGATRKPTIAVPAAPAPRPVVRTALPDPAPARPATTTPKPRPPRT
jgi:membrane-bound lytic murein transglycosylase D